MGIRFTLKDTLSELDITKNKIAVESKTRPATIADLVNGDSKRLEIDTLTSILNSLNRIAKEKNKEKTYRIEDIIVYIPDEDEN